MTKSSEIPTRWWGWGDIDKTYPVEERPTYIPFLEEKLGIKVKEVRVPDPDIESVKLRNVRLKEATLKALAGVVGNKHVSTSRHDRVYHGLGKSYRDLLRGHLEQVPNPPDAVLFPASEKEVKGILKIADKEAIAVVPFCGGSSVVGGVEPLNRKGLKGSITVDLRRMDKVIHIDGESQTATFEAGIWGPELEEELMKQGLYLGHAPESFKFSGLGGWIASRSAGRQSTGYGKIEEMVKSVRMVTPRGVIDTLDVPASATGPDMDQIICGSEGTLGIITRATVKVRPLPESYDYRGLLFREFEGGVQAVREMMQSGIVPETIRISDTEESALAMIVRKPSSNAAKEMGTMAALKVLDVLGYSFKRGSFAILGCEGEEDETSARMKSITAVCRKHGAVPLGKSAGNEWYHGRYDHPYLRDIMMGWGVMIDTLETATTWDNIMNVYHTVGKAIREAIADYGSKSIVTCHLSHSYRTGSSLYFIFFGKQAKGREIEQWEHLKKKAGDALLSSGATISHHHGVGYEHAPWFKKEYGKRGMGALRGLKKELDPKGIMNPGKLGL
ncbi:MAG: FAD-binding oxidoreductase [Actinobacteria bacterium]|nr:FAD-binding oxidoreductase [Actinomycetota bacterium]